jgi:hypothetical protein
VWQDLHTQIEPKGASVVTVALDVDPEFARPWIDRAQPSHPSLIDTAHRIDELLGITNVPMAVWIDEDGVLVRPAELASLSPSPLRSAEIPDGIDERLKLTLEAVRSFPDPGYAYRDAILDWVEHGAVSRYALAPDEVIARSQPRPIEHARAAACFELGQELWRTLGHDAAVPWWREAHRLHPENWTYKRQAWTFVTSQPGQPPDLLQGPNDTYEGNWLDDVIRLGGGAAYYPEPHL